MNKSLLAILLLGLVAVAAFFPTPSFAQEDEADAEQTTDEKQAYETDEEQDEGSLGPADGIETTFMFKDASKKVKLGQLNTIFVHMQNKGSTEYNVTYLGGSLHSPTEYSYFIQNFSTIQLPQSVFLAPNEEASLEFVFQPDEKLHPVEVWMSAWVIYNASNSIFRSTVYNSTVELVEEKASGVRSFFTYFLLLAAAGLVGYTYLRVNTAVKEQKEAKEETGTRKAAAAPSLQIYTPAKESKPVARRRTGASSPKKKASSPKKAQ